MPNGVTPSRSQLFVLYTEGQYVLLDTTGLQVHNISADFEQLGGTVDRWYDTDNGAIIQFKLGESIYFKFYDFTKAVEAGTTST